MKKHESTLEKDSFKWLDHGTTIESGSNVATTIDPGDKNIRFKVTDHSFLIINHVNRTFRFPIKSNNDKSANKRELQISHSLLNKKYKQRIHLYTKSPVVRRDS